MQPKLFKVTSYIYTEYGKDYDKTEQYFLAHSIETVYAVIRDRYGMGDSMEKYYSTDKITEVYEVNEVRVECL